MPAPKDPEKRKLWLARVSACQIGRIPWNKGLKGAQKSCRKGITMEEEYGAERAEQIKLKMKKAHLGKILTEEHKRHIGEAFTGEKHWMFGKHHSKKSRKKISRTLKGNPVRYWKGKHLGKKTREKLSKSHKGLLAGQNHPMWGKRGVESPNWKGGLSFGAYSVEFNRQLKELIRNRDGYMCQKCGIPECENGKKLSVHHIDYDKKNCLPSNLISLCLRCNTEVNYNRKFWTEYFRSEVKFG